MIMSQSLLQRFTSAVRGRAPTAARAAPGDGPASAHPVPPSMPSSAPLPAPPPPPPARPPTPEEAAEAMRSHFVALFRETSAPKGIVVAYDAPGGPITVTRGRQRFVVAAEHFLYAGDLCNQFDYYFGSTVPEERDGLAVVDYSRPGWHVDRASGRRMFYTSLAEDAGATRDYMEYLAPGPGETVLDVGSYCGLSVLAFAEAVGPSGRVLAFEPDPRNHAALLVNLRGAGEPTNVVVENKAVSGAAGTLRFSSEGNMGSALVSKESPRGAVIEVESTTLRDVVARHGLGRVGAIKLDIEGAEYGVIESSEDLIPALGARWAVELHADPVTETPVDVDRVRRVFDRLDHVTVLQAAGDHAAAPTVFAYPRSMFRRA